MKIISKFKDYYDGGVQFGIDLERLYIRETKQISDKNIHNHNKFSIIGFCGEIFPFIEKKDYKRFYFDPKVDVLYGEDSYKFDYDYNLSKFVYQDDYRIRRFKEAYNSYVNSKELKSLFLKYKTPIFYIPCDYYIEKDINLILNPILKNFGFFKVKNSFEAFKEIEMYISNVLVENPEIKVPVGSDKDLLYSKGFDDKSFRKEKSK